MYPAGDGRLELPVVHHVPVQWRALTWTAYGENSSVNSIAGKYGQEYIYPGYIDMAGRSSAS